MGVPARSFETGGVRYLAYDEHRIDIVQRSDLRPLLSGLVRCQLPPQVIEWHCETTSEVAGGTVKSFMLRGNACG